jgi:hypothetical protein
MWLVDKLVRGIALAALYVIRFLIGEDEPRAR